jgi:hypothetical protein
MGKVRDQPTLEAYLAALVDALSEEGGGPGAFLVRGKPLAKLAEV